MYKTTDTEITLYTIFAIEINSIIYENNTEYPDYFQWITSMKSPTHYKGKTNIESTVKIKTDTGQQKVKFSDPEHLANNLMKKIRNT